MGGDPTSGKSVSARRVAGARGGRRGRFGGDILRIVPTLATVPEDAMEEESSAGSPDN